MMIADVKILENILPSKMVGKFMSPKILKNFHMSVNLNVWEHNAECLLCLFQNYHFMSNNVK